MTRGMESFFRRLRRDRSGSVAVVVALSMTALLGFGALSVDVGYAYLAQSALQAATDAAAMAGAEAITQGNNPTTAAQSYSATAGSYNAAGFGTYQNAGVAAPTVVLYSCTTTSGFSCTAGATATSNPPANAISVTQTAKVPTYFAHIFGVSYVSISAQSTAMAAAGVATQINVALILDTTKSMGSAAVGPALTSCPVATYPTAEDCALSGIQAILGELWPCASGVTCPATPAVDEVALFIFPGVNSVPAGYHCSASLTPVPYNHSPAPVYEIVPFAADYRTSDTATTVVDGVAGGNASSDLLQCAAPASVSTSLGNSANSSWEGGEGTYYAGAITAAQAALAALSSSRPGATNVIILLTDGDANSSSGGTNQCKAAVTAAWAAAKAGTLVYAIYYDDNTASTCSRDTGNYTGANPLGACYTLQQLASSPTAQPDPTKFYSTDGTSAASGSCPSSYAYTKLDTIFQNIASSFMTARLIPNP